MFSPAPAGVRVPGLKRPGTEGDDQTGIGVLYDYYVEKVFAYVAGRISDRTEAEDITAETFEAAVVAQSRFRGDSTGYSWLLGIARQKIAEAVRRRSRQSRRERLDAELTDVDRETLGLLLAEDLTEMPEEALLHEEARQVMDQLLERLPEDQREALLLQIADDLPIREIARVMGRSVAATNSLLQRARAAIFRHGHDYFKG